MILLGAFFVFMAAKNLSGDEAMAADFQRWGYADWFRKLTAWLQIVGAIGLLVPVTTFFGGLLLCGVLVGAAVTHLRFDSWQHVVSPLVFLVFMGLIVLVNRPGGHPEAG